MRGELDRLLRSNELWDGRVGVLQVADAVDGYVRVRMLVSAANAPVLFDLRCDVREGIVRWLQHAQPGALPRRRIEPAELGQGPAAPTADAVTGARRADSGLFSGSPGAQRRGRAFESPGHQDDPVDGREFASTRPRG
jgi:hypothetical protein